MMSTTDTEALRLLLLRELTSISKRWEAEAAEHVKLGA